MVKVNSNEPMKGGAKARRVTVPGGQREARRQRGRDCEMYIYKIPRTNGIGGRRKVC